MVCPYDKADVVPISALKHAIAMAGDGSLKAPARLAVACRSNALGSGPISKLMVCLVGGGNTAGTSTPQQHVQVLVQLTVQEPILGLAWCSDSILMALPSGYRLVVSGGATTDIAPHTCPQPMVVPITPAKQALLLLADNMVVSVDPTGSAVSAPLLLGGYPLALATVGNHLLAVTEEAVEVVDRTTGAKLQSIPFVHDDAWVQAARKLPSSLEDWGAGYVLFTTSSQVFGLAAVPPEQQVQELLKRHHYAAALELIAARCTPPPPRSTIGIRRRTGSITSIPQALMPPDWCYHAVVQTSVLLMQRLRFLPALALLLLLPPHVWQPCQLLALFPPMMTRWARELTSQVKMWSGPMGGLIDLKRLVTDQLELLRATQSVTRVGALLSGLRHSSQGGGGTGEGRGMSFSLADQVDEYMMTAKAIVSAYLQLVRSVPGLHLLDALDTLCLDLLLEVGLVGQLERLLAVPGCQALLRDATMLLTSKNRWHALALLRTTHNHTQEALDIWESLGRAQVMEDTSHNLTPSTLDQAGHAADSAQEDSTPAPTLASAAQSHAQLVKLVGSLVAVHGPARNTFMSAFAPPSLGAASLQLPSFMALLPEVLQQASQVEARVPDLATHGSLPNLDTAAVHTQGTHPTPSPLSSFADGSLSGLQAAQGNQTALAAAAMTSLLSLTEVTIASLPPLTPFQPTGSFLAPHFPSPSPSPGIFPDLFSSTSGVKIMVQQNRGPTTLGPLAGQPLQPPQPPLHTRTTLPSAHHGVLIPQTAFLPYAVHAATWSDVATSQVVLPVMAVPSQPVTVDLVLQKLPWLLQTYPGDALSVLCARPDLPLTDVLQLLNSRTDDIRWRYLLYIVYQQHNNQLTQPTQPPLQQQQTSWTRSPARQGSQGGAGAGPTGRIPSQGGLVGLASPQGPPLPPPLTEEEASALHTELALELIECLGRELAVQDAIVPSTESQPPAQGQGQQQQGSHQTVSANLSVRGLGGYGQLGSVGAQGGDAAGTAALSRFGWLCSVLSGHLAVSNRYDPAVVLAAVHATCPGRLLAEEVALYRRQNNHPAALGILVRQLGDVEAAVAYCRQQQAALYAQHGQAGHSGGAVRSMRGGGTLDVQAASAAAASAISQEVEQLWMALLECCLRPGPGREPMYGAALRVLAAPTATVSGGLGVAPQLDPIKVLNALPDTMPLSLAAETLASMITATGHRHRSAQVLKSLYRSQNLELRAEYLSLTSQRVVVNESTTCKGCHRLLAGKIFIRSPSGLLLCDRCARVTTGGGAAGGGDDLTVLEDLEHMYLQ